ncbi:hypothetical protein HJD18_00695 [Thermoleophilia bacterium SCSIO 60948]|nr:hypothetical protein HJD18_00695 [Thermoleophilia bacterium SCSIO 60948]
MQSSVRRAPLRAILALAVLAAALTAAFAVHPPSSGAAPDAASAQTAKGKKPKRKQVSVMSRNIYLGADLTDAIESETPGQAIAANQQIWDDVAENNFPARARLLAKEINAKRPDLVGLQEVALWRYDPPSSPGGIGDGSATPAEEVRFDYLQSLLTALGGKYRVVQSQNQFDFEGQLQAGTSREGGDGRLTMRDVILARKNAGVKTTNPASGSFENSYTVQVGGGSGVEVEVLRGWESTIANVRGARFKFVNTHLEAFDNDAKLAQAQELVAPADGDEPAGPANPQASHLPIVLVGDLNSDDEIVERLGDTENHQRDELPYAAVREAGFLERSPDKAGLENDRLSCCMNGSVIDAPVGSPDAELTHVVDHVMVDDRRIKLAASAVTGTNPRTESGLAASDHSGVFSKLSFPPSR